MRMKTQGTSGLVATRYLSIILRQVMKLLGRY